MPSFPVASAIFGGFFTIADYISSQFPVPSCQIIVARIGGISPRMPGVSTEGKLETGDWKLETILMSWFRKSQLDPLAVTMAGVKLADRLLILGAGDVALTAALATKAGLTGRACVLDASESATAASSSAVEREGALIESFTAPWTMLPFDPHAFDVAVLRNVLKGLDPDARLRCATEVHRVLRPGGRTVIIEDMDRGGFGALFRGGQADAFYERGGGATHALEAAGFRGVRTLAEREGHVFVEGVKAST
jgi:SAM-dependent methyltransferase